MCRVLTLVFSSVLPKKESKTYSKGCLCAVSMSTKKAMLPDSWEFLLEVLEDKSIELTQMIAAMGLEVANIVLTLTEYGGLPKR